MSLAKALLWNLDPNNPETLRKITLPSNPVPDPEAPITQPSVQISAPPIKKEEIKTLPNPSPFFLCFASNFKLCIIFAKIWRKILIK
jgi:hypothetical protein